MCGRLGIVATAGELREYLNVSADAAAADHSDGSLPLPPEGLERYNLAPSRRRGGAVHWERLPVLRGQNGQRRLDMLVWPLIPSWAGGELPDYHTANCRSEPDRPFAATVAGKPAFRNAWQKRRRSLIPACWFYEWDQRSKPKTPYRVSSRQQPWFTFAGLWDRSRAADGTAIASCTIITTAPNRLLRDIGHHRSPVIIAPEDQDQWLLGSDAEAQALLRPPPDNAMEAARVSRAVNNPEYDDPALLEPVRA